MRCASSSLNDYFSMQSDQTLTEPSSTNVQVLVHNPYGIPCATTSSVPEHFRSNHHPPQLPQQNTISNAVTTASSTTSLSIGLVSQRPITATVAVALQTSEVSARERRKKRGVASLQPVIIWDWFRWGRWRKSCQPTTSVHIWWLSLCTSSVSWVGFETIFSHAH